MVNFFYRPKVFSHYFSAIVSSSPLSKIFFLMNIKESSAIYFKNIRHSTFQNQTLNYLCNKGFI